MARETLDRKIHHLLDEILALDSMVEEAIMQSVIALKGQNIELAQRLNLNDQVINSKRFELENECMITIATQQPIMGRDLRLLASILEVAGELERMGDYAKGIAKVCIKVGKEPHIKPLVDIPIMAQQCVSMLHRAISAFVHGDAETAQEIPGEDDSVDHLYNKVYRELITIMLADSKTIDQANHLMWVAHNLERVADRVTNICERTIYIQTGELKEIDMSDDESKTPV